MKRDSQYLKIINMPIKEVFTIQLEHKFWIMLGKVIIAVCLPMDKLEQENHIVWLDISLI
jgi:hypothetical protein